MARSKLVRRGVAVVVSLAAILLLAGFAAYRTFARTMNRENCASGLRQIGMAVEIYSREHGGALPDSIITLGRTTDLVPEVFTCPSSGAEMAHSWDALAADPSPKHASYRYLGDRLTTADLVEGVVLAMDLLENHDNDGVNVLFGDGHVEFLAYSRRKPPAWVGQVQQQIDAGVRPVRIGGAK